MKKSFIVIVLIMIGSIINAQHTISGRIIDQDSVPLQGAIVFSVELNKGTTADKDGYYTLKNLPNGIFRIQYSFVGHIQVIKTVRIEHTDILINTVLPLSIVEADEVVVSGAYNTTQHENAVKIEILKPSAHSRVSPNFTETLSRIPGVDMISKGSGVSKPVIRGLSMNDILVLNNGVRFENYQYSSHHPLGIDESGIESIEIIKGPASLLYGSDAIGGVINFLREKPAPQHTVSGDYSLQLFSNSLGLATNAGIKGMAEKLSAGLRAGMKSHADYMQGGGTFVPNSRFNEYSVKAGLGYSGSKATFKLYYDYIRQNLGLVEEEAFTEITKRQRECTIFYQQMGSHLLSSQNKFYLGKVKLDVNASWQNAGLTHFGEANEYEIQMKLSTLIYETRLSLLSGKKADYIIGLQVINQKNKNLNDRETKLLPNAGMNNYSAFGMMQYTLFKKIKLQTGIRYDYKTIITKSIGSLAEPESYRMAIDKNYGSFSGSLGATYSFGRNFHIRANMATAYRTPNLAELTSNGQHETRYEVGNPDLIPEKSFETDLSFHYHGERLTFEVSGFYNRIRDYLYISPTEDTTLSGLPIYRYMQNNSLLFGGEAGLHYHPSPVRWLHLQSTFSSVRGKHDNGENLPFIPANKLDFEIRADKEKLLVLQEFFFTINISTAFDQNNAATDELPTDGYTLTDCSTGGNIGNGKNPLSLIVSVLNIFDVKYADHLSTLKEVGMHNPGRNFVVAIRVPFGKNE